MPEDRHPPPPEPLLGWLAPYLEGGMDFLRGVTGLGEQGPAGPTWTNAGALLSALPLTSLKGLATAGTTAMREARAAKAGLRPLVEMADLSAAHAMGGYQPATGRVMLDRASVQNMSKADRAALVRHELAHKAESETDAWQDSLTYLWDLWERDKQHPLFDYMGEHTGASKLNDTSAAEIIARLYEHDYPRGSFVVKDRPVPYPWEGEHGGPREYSIPEELLSVLDRIEGRLGIWTKKQARGTAPAPSRFSLRAPVDE